MERKNRYQLSTELYKLALSACGLTYEDGIILDSDNRKLGRYQSRFAPLCKTVKFDNEVIDGVVIFGDGCVELHDKAGQDAYNWDNYPNSVLSEVVNNIQIILE
jgi:hypothetical protein